MTTRQTTLHISFPDDEIDLYNELRRVSCLTYTPTSMLCRQLVRDGLKSKSLTEKLSPVCQMKTIKLTPLLYEMLVEISKKHKPPVKPDKMMEELILSYYNKGK